MVKTYRFIKKDYAAQEFIKKDNRAYKLYNKGLAFETIEKSGVWGKLNNDYEKKQNEEKER